MKNLALPPKTDFTGFAFPPHRMEGKIQQETETIILSVQRKKNAINILVETAETLKIKVKWK